MFEQADLFTLRLAYSVFRVTLVAAAAGALVWMARRPRPTAAFALLLLLNLAAWAAYVAPLRRLYAITGLDRSLNVGTAACVAAGHSPWDNVQVGYAALEPFWDVLVAALAGFEPARVVHVYGWLAPLVLAFVAGCLYFGLRRAPGCDSWEAVATAFVVLGLSSFSLGRESTLPPAWIGNFLLKPNHAAGWGLIAVALALRGRAASWWRLGLVLGLSAWVFLLHWAFLLAGLFAGALLRPSGRRGLGGLAAAAVLSLAMAVPQVANLARDFSPFGEGGSPARVWQILDQGRALALPHVWTLDLGLLLLAALAGAWVMWRRRSAVDADRMGFLAAMWLLAALVAAATAFGFAPEPDEVHYTLRLAAALAGGAALAALARMAESRWGWPAGRGHLLLMAALTPLTLPAWWDPPTMDRYFSGDRRPIEAGTLALGRWIRESTREDAVFAAGLETARWIPALTGRRVLLLGDRRPPADYAARKAIERRLLLQGRPDGVRAAAARYGVTHVALDAELREEYGVDRPRSEDAYRLVFRSEAVAVFALAVE